MEAPTVLVVEDDVLIRLGIADHLRHCGYQVIEAENGQEAVSLLAGGAPADLVFTDMQMPGAVDGFGVVRWLREHRPELPVLIASGHALALELADQLCDVRSAFAKPYSEVQVAAAIADLVAHRRMVWPSGCEQSPATDG
ncbi:MAG TPA: response regulator [Caulobacter sp.]|nr:response regulator [Caulobacter sp.]